MQYLADRKPDAKLAPANGTFERARLQEWLNFITSELHKSFSALFNASMPDAAKAIYKEKIAERFALIDATLAKQDYLLGPNPSVADVYLFVVTRWSKHFDIDLGRWPALAAFMDRMAERASVKAALNAESQARKPPSRHESLRTRRDTARFRRAARAQRYLRFLPVACRQRGDSSGRDLFGDVVMAHERFHLQQEVLVLGVVHRAVRIFAGEGAHGVHRFPQRDQHDLAMLALVAAQDRDAAIARRLCIVAQAGFMQVGEVVVRLFLERDTAPDASDHG